MTYRIDIFRIPSLPLDILRRVLSRSGISWNQIKFTLRNGDLMRMSMSWVAATGYPGRSESRNLIDIVFLHEAAVAMITFINVSHII